MLRSISEFYKQKKRLISYILIASVITLSLNYLQYRSEYSSLESGFARYIALHKRVNLAQKVWLDRLDSDEYEGTFNTAQNVYRQLGQEFYELYADTESINVLFFHTRLISIKKSLLKTTKLSAKLSLVNSTMDDYDGKLASGSYNRARGLEVEATAYEENTLKQLKSVSNNLLFWDYKGKMRNYGKLFNEWH